MAGIDPSIALQGNNTPVDLFAGAKKGLELQSLAMRPEQIQQEMAASRQSVAASKAQQANTEAALPGVAATSVTAQQAAKKAQQDQAANDKIMELSASGKYTTTDAKTGNKSLDFPKLYGELFQSHPQQAAKMAADKYDTDFKQYSAKSAETKSTGELNAIADGMVQSAANMIDKSGLPEDQKGKNFQDILTRQAEHNPEAFKNSPYVTFGDDGKPIITPLGGSDVKKIAAGSMTPLQERQMHLQEFTASPDTIKQIALNAGDITPVTAKVDAAKTVAAGTAYQTDLNNSLNTTTQINKIIGTGRFGARLTSEWAKAKQGPDSGVLATYQKGIDAYNTVHPDPKDQIDLARDGIEAANAKLQAESTRNLGNIAIHKSLITTPSPSAAIGSTPNTSAPPAPAAPVRKATAASEAKVRANPALAAEFKARFGYLPAGM
jgi:hypothetical protein